ncbi:restriction endonuclease [Komagataeibacter nataicola]|uniref:restriction endonuclease n=1 Tax=Komagataeibacter nataicola TaxID=265960 RepID=UPI0028ACC399|nr:restriction endonuclease [Komagataeibacter nataicola]WNM09516.1 restriction endonuclease [Komagataeibacter nataicola]
MRAGIMPWLGLWLLLTAALALAAPTPYQVAPAAIGCTQVASLRRVAELSLSMSAAAYAQALAQLHCQRVDGAGTWQLLGTHDTVARLRPLPVRRGEVSLYFASSAVSVAALAPAALPPGVWRLVLAGGVAVLLWSMLRYGGQWWRRGRAWRLCGQLVRHHAEALRIRRQQLVQFNSYGVERTTKWEREQAEFVRTIIQPALRGKRLAATWPALAPRVLALIDQVARQVPAGTRAADGFSPDMDPIAYERYCAARLRACGWDAHATPPGGDQGADVIAVHGHVRLVVQCKLYRNAVGNEAVQQIAAARLHYHADVAAVVSNADYTIPARQLARSNNVFLLHHDELPAFAARLARARKKA